MPVTVTEMGGLHPEGSTTTTTTTIGTAASYQLQYYNSSSSGCEIEEENSSELFEIGERMTMPSIREDAEGSLFSLDVHSNVEDCVYVGVGKSESSLDALSWTLKNAVSKSTIVYLIHVFPEIHHIPSPLGKLPKSRVSPGQVESFMAQERGKRRELLQKFLNMCSASQVKVDSILIESDGVGKAILDLIPILNMKKLVLGTTKSTLRKLKSRRVSGIADQVLQNAPEFCEIKIICDGKEVIEQMIGLPSPRTDEDNAKSMQVQVMQDHSNNDSFGCMCFKSPRAT